MPSQREDLRTSGRGRRRTAVATLSALAFLAAACGDDSSSGGDEGSGDAGLETDEVDELLGAADEASGDPVRIGMVSDGATDAFDNRDELRAAEATAEYWNTHQAGVAGRPVEVVTCETGADEAGATDCANQFIESDVVAVGLSQSAVQETIWEALHDAGIPTFWFQASGEGPTEDPDSSYVLLNPEAALFGLPVAVAEDVGADAVSFVVIDVPQARTGLEEQGPEILGNAGLDLEVVPVAAGTADMTPQMQEVADSGAEVVHVTGNDAFCIAAFNGLAAVGYEGEIVAISQCITDATREAVDGEILEGIHVTSTMALGDTEAETYRRYEAVMADFGDEVEEVDHPTAMGGYVTMASLLTALAEFEGDEVTAETANEAIRSMPEQDLPGSTGGTFQCGGSASPELPAVCTNDSLQTQLDGEGEPTTYELVDSSDILG